MYSWGTNGRCTDHGQIEDILIRDKYNMYWLGANIRCTQEEQI